MSASTATTDDDLGLAPAQRAAALRDHLLDHHGGSPAEQRARHAQATRQQQALLCAYAGLRGWKRSGVWFTLDALARGRLHSGGQFHDRVLAGAPDGLFDHTDRWKLNGRPVAVTSQPYNFGPELRA